MGESVSGHVHRRRFSAADHLRIDKSPLCIGSSINDAETRVASTAKSFSLRNDIADDRGRAKPRANNPTPQHAEDPPHLLDNMGYLAKSSFPS